MYKLFYRTLLSRIDAEIAHTYALFFLKWFGFLLKPLLLEHHGTEVMFFGKRLKNPIGIAGGVDKNGVAIGALFGLGFGFVEVGTVTPKPQAGNPKPRIFRVGENGEGIINRMGFPNAGAAALLARLRKFDTKRYPNHVIGVNIGRNKDGTEEDYFSLIRQFHDKVDYIAINISSPNTPGLRDLLKEAELESFIKDVKKTREECGAKVPFFLKISPDMELTSISYIYRILTENAIEGVIVSNTTISRPSVQLKNMNEMGGLSGKFLKEKSLAMLKEFNKFNAERKIYVISAGGVETRKDISLRMQNGANLVQIYTSFVTEGPLILNKLL